MRIGPGESSSCESSFSAMLQLTNTLVFAAGDEALTLLNFWTSRLEHGRAEYRIHTYAGLIEKRGPFYRFHLTWKPPGRSDGEKGRARPRLD